MGTISLYKCDCGYSESIFDGSGMIFPGLSDIEGVFGKNAIPEDGELASYDMSNVLSVCDSCKRLITAPRLRYRLEGAESVFRILNRCPNCGDETEKEELDPSRGVNCPRCGKCMRRSGLGLWD